MGASCVSKNWGVELWFESPLEYFFLLLPAALLELAFGIGAPALGASLLLLAQAVLPTAMLR